MGLAALFVAGLIVLAIAGAIVYGTFVGLARFGQFLWQLLLGPDVATEEVAATEEGLAGLPCWQDQDCPLSVRQTCPAYLQRDDLPCWLANLQAEGRLRVKCLTCHRFDLAALVA